MEAQASKAEYPILNALCIAVACIAVIVLCAAAITAILDRIPVFDGGGPASQSANAPAALAAQGSAQSLAQAPAQAQAPN